MCMVNHLPTTQILISSRGKNLTPRLVNEPGLTNEYAHPPPFNPDSDHEQGELSTPRLVNEPWLTNVYAHPPPHSPDSDHEQRNIFNP
jgi:rRNA maturation protein Nop10